MEFLFFTLLSTIIFVYAGYPVVLCLLGAFASKPARPSDQLPRVSLIVPAHNEEKCIREKLENCLDLDYPKESLEIIVGSDGSDDGTNNIVQEYASKGIMLNADKNRVGKCSVLKRCVGQAKGDIIVFSDADATLEPDALRNLVAHFSDTRIGCVEGVRRDKNEKGLLLDSLYWKYETMIKGLNSKLQAILGATGALFAVRKNLYDPINDQRGDDFEIPVRVRVKGYGAVLEPKALAYHPWLSNEDEFGRIVRIVAWMMPSALILLKESIFNGRILLAFQLLTHKILRWLIPFFLVGLMAVNLNLEGSFYRLFLYLQFLFYAVALCGLAAEKAHVKLPAIARVPYFFCLINTASMVGVLKFMFGLGNMDWTKTARDEN